MLRWNEILRELVARYNLPPAPRPDGSYPIPDAANPFSDPQFPFANPPYAARAYSYVSVAAYDALKVAWHYKYLYRRPAPSQVDSSVAALVPAGDTPAYPSEDAAMSGVAEVLLRALFPAAVDEINARAAEQRNAALWSGRAAPSDLAAGLALGRAVAAVALTRAGSDGMRTAGGTRRADAGPRRRHHRARGDRLAQPRGPAAPAHVAALRPGAGVDDDAGGDRGRAAHRPAVHVVGADGQEAAEVRRTLDELTRDQLAIAYKWSDGVGTYTPPGHWNEIAAGYIRSAGHSEVRAARGLALVNMAMHDAAVGCWDAKFTYFNPRPSQIDPRVKTVLGVPNFPAYTSGHSTFSAAAAAVLAHLFPDKTAEVDAMKDEAGISRLYGGIHYRADIEDGKAHGTRIGGYTVRFAREDGAQ